MLLGILLCASNKKMKAEVFFRMFKKDSQTLHIEKNDVLLPEYVEKMQEISYTMMI
jgi:hypothetical protein